MLLLAVVSYIDLESVKVPEIFLVLCIINKLKLKWQIKKCSFEPFLSQSSGSLMKGIERSSACQQCWKALISAVSEWQLWYFTVLLLRTIGIIGTIIGISVPLWLSLCTDFTNTIFTYRSSWFFTFLSEPMTNIVIVQRIVSVMLMKCSSLFRQIRLCIRTGIRTGPRSSVLSTKGVGDTWQVCKGDVSHCMRQILIAYL